MQWLVGVGMYMQYTYSDYGADMYNASAQKVVYVTMTFQLCESSGY